jgi:hypothetical protein
VKAGTEMHGQREMHMSQAHVRAPYLRVPHSAFFWHGRLRLQSGAMPRAMRATLYSPVAALSLHELSANPPLERAPCNATWNSKPET